MNFWVNVRKYLAVLGVSLIPILVLRYVGWIDSVTSALGPVAVAVVFLIIRDFAPDDFKKPCYWIAGAILTLTILLPVGWGMWGVWSPETRLAFQYASQEKKIVAADKTMSVGLVGKASKYHFCNEVDRKQGEVIIAQHAQLLLVIEENPFDEKLLERRKVLEEKIRRNVALRQECKDFMASLSAGKKPPRADQVVSESSEFAEFFRNVWESYRSKMWADQLFWALIIFAIVALIARGLMKRSGTAPVAYAPAGQQKGAKTEYSIMIVWVGAAAFLALLTGFYGMGHWLIPAIVLGAAILWAVIHGKNQNWQNGLAMACIIWVMVGLGFVLVWGIGWDAYHEQSMRAGANATVQWLIRQ